ncbi:hypothetical protein [Mucilaginibacter sp. AK015]|uniref:hypothetical protein n=1 Tax=Mucilaginibacter sp. AK015 TaxID=2723072 RepID=UPI0018526705|nr:hypothetical protein [Mucilaginibacter sp. AK015]MBB5397308.1 putative protein tyrosine phosphatase [Mucilaginibacter sp. AK015]
MDWADVVFVMENKHRDLVKQRFASNSKQLVVLNIPDDYRFNDPELIEMLNAALGEWL